MCRHSSFEAEGQITAETALHKLRQHLNHCSSAALSPSHKLVPISSKAEDRAAGRGEAAEAKKRSPATPHPCAEGRSPPLGWTDGLRG